MRWCWSRLHLQAKFKFFVILGLLIWLSNISIFYFEVHDINQAALDLEGVEDLYNMVLEIRRYEKNYLLYQGRDNFAETDHFFQRAQEKLAEVSAAREVGRESEEIDQLKQAFHEYEKVLDRCRELGVGVIPSEDTQDSFRRAGKQMVDLSAGVLAWGRRQVAVAAQNALVWPLISMGLILVLFTVGAVLVNRKVVKPLVELERATEKTGRGDFSRIHHPTRVESEVDRLTISFNRMLEELETRQEQIIHSRKIASLGTLVSGVAHELNNPINNIILTIDSLTGRRAHTAERQAVLLQDMLTQALRASGIVKNLLDFSRADSSAVQDLDIEKLLEETFLISRNQLTVNRINLTLDISPGLPMVRGNRQSLQQVLINLVTNAVQAMPDGGDLAVEAALDKDGRICITVRDTGEGIPEEHLSRIFDPFFTTKKVGQGTGLGLSVSYGIISKLGGRISVDSQLGKGSVFTVLLPATDEVIDG